MSRLPSFFAADGDRFVPSSSARGPWSARYQHGGPPAALLARAFARQASDGARIARLTFDFVRPMPLAPLTVATRVVRAGAKVQRFAGSLLAESGPFELLFMSGDEGYHRAMEWRLARGTFGRGPTAVWMRPRVALVAGETPTPLQCLVTAADSASGVAPAVDPHTTTFVNGDLTIALHRAPVGEWTCLDAAATGERHGVGLARARLWGGRCRTWCWSGADRAHVPPPHLEGTIIALPEDDMATTTGVKAPRALAETRRWAAPGSRSAALFAQAQGVMPGGNTRTTVYMAPYPPYAASGEGCWITDVEGDRRLDCLNNYTALIHGHAHPAIVEAATRRLALGSSFPLPTPEEIELAGLLCERLPSAERVRFTNSGSEAVMMAIKGARAWTGRPKIAKFEGAYHGSYDYAEVSLASSPESWGSLAAPASTPYSKGVPPAVLDDVVVLPFNHTELAVARIEREAKQLAAVLVDPIPNRVGLIPAQRDFLRALREVTSRYGIALIFDEVITFRVGYHGAQGVFGVTPDLTTLGKIIGGGFPVGAVAGRADVMAVFDPTGGKPAAPHGGTFNANPVTMAAGLAAMRLLTPEAFGRLDELGAKLRASLEACFKGAGVPGAVTGLGSLFRLHPTDRELIDYRSTRTTPEEEARLHRMVRGLMERGVLMSITGLGCLSTPMGDAELESLVETFATVLAAAG